MYISSMVSFPELKDEDYTKDGTPIYGGSIGMNIVYDSLVTNAGKDNRFAFRVIAINALTLIRNNYDQNFRVMQEKCRKDLLTLVTYLSIYLRKTNSLDNRKVSLILFYPDYSNLPDNLKRTYTTEMIRLMEFYKLDSRDVKMGLHKHYSDDVINVFSFKAGSKHVYPHTSLSKLLLEQVTNVPGAVKDFPYRVGDNVYLISHVALDWHLSNTIKNVGIIESYTGKIVTSDYFGSKLLKIKDIKVPFNSFIHQAFGDHTLIKPLAVRKIRKELLSKVNKWSMMTNSKILTQICDVLGVSSQALTKYKF